MRKTFDELEYLDQPHLDFITKYLKYVLDYSQFGRLEKLYEIGTVVNSSEGLGVVVGYCGVGYEYVLFENDREKGYYVRGTEGMKLKEVKKIAPSDAIPLMLKMNDYLLKNQFRLSTAHQKICYEHWIRTGKYEFKNPIGNTEREKLEIKRKIDEKRKELKELENQLQQL